ncbi:MAG: hypothetical protein WC028_23345, partial [Candidatus Obscuribacterales bacterium]
ISRTRPIAAALYREVRNTTVFLPYRQSEISRTRPIAAALYREVRNTTVFLPYRQSEISRTRPIAAAHYREVRKVAKNLTTSSNLTKCLNNTILVSSGH